jgi:3-oxoacyl-(acyl-carrier-protein) synthase
MNEPVVITATSAICAAGADLDRIYQALLAGRTSFAPLRDWDSSSWPVPQAAGVDRLDAGAIFADRKLLKSVQRLHRTDLLGLYAASRAVKASGIVEHRTTME